MLMKKTLAANAATRLQPCCPSVSIRRSAGSRVRSVSVLNKATKTGTVIPSPSYNLPLGLFAISGVSVAAQNTTLAVITGILGVFLTIQASRVKFIFGETGLEVAIGEKKEAVDNAFVGGANVWSYDKFINWELWWPGFPILTYFKETQTKPEGQIHFFPIIFNGKELYDVMSERCGPTKTSGPKE